MTQADFARAAGVSRAAIAQAISRGRLHKDASGGIDENAAESVAYLSTVKRQRRQAHREKPENPPLRIVTSEREPRPRRERRPREAGVNVDADHSGESYSDAERRDKIAAADLKEQKLAITRGDLLPREQVKLVLSKVYAVIRAQVKTLGERIGPDLTASLGLDDSKSLVVQSAVEEDVEMVLVQIKADILAYLEQIGDGEELR